MDVRSKDAVWMGFNGTYTVYFRPNVEAKLGMTRSTKMQPKWWNNEDMNSAWNVHDRRWGLKRPCRPTQVFFSLVENYTSATAQWGPCPSATIWTQPNREKKSDISHSRLTSAILHHFRNYCSSVCILLAYFRGKAWYHAVAVVTVNAAQRRERERGGSWVNSSLKISM